MRRAALYALKQMGPKARDAVPKILETYRTRGREGYCLAALVRIAPDDERTLAAAVECLESNRGLRVVGARALAKLGPRAKSAEAKLRATDAGLLRDEFWLWRQCALWKIGGRPADRQALLAPLRLRLERFGRATSNARSVTTHLLETLGPDARELIPLVTELLEDPELPGRERLADALAAMRRSR